MLSNKFSEGNQQVKFSGDPLIGVWISTSFPKAINKGSFQVTPYLVLGLAVWKFEPLVLAKGKPLPQIQTINWRGAVSWLPFGTKSCGCFRGWFRGIGRSTCFTCRETLRKTGLPS